MGRPEWIVCITKPHASDKHLSWCGMRIIGFALMGLDHAACLQGSRLVPCVSCVDAATVELKRLSSEGVGL